MTDRIDIKSINLKRQKVTEPFFLYIELNENYFLYRAKFYADEPKEEDEALGWHNVFNDFEFIARKSHIAAMEREWLNDSKVWMITLFIDGVGPDIKLYFKRESECVEVYNKITAYLWPSPQL